MIRQLSLTEDQNRAVCASDERILLLAPPGSGKTEVLVRRIERILTETAGEAFRLLAVTYTVKAAEELRNRIKETVSGDAWRVDCDTLHGFALEWLMRYGSAVGISPSVVVYSDEPDRSALLADSLGALGLASLGEDPKQTLSRVLASIDDWRTRSPHLPPPETQIEGVNLAEVLEAYNTSLARVGGVDFPAMLAKFGDLMEVDPWVVENFQKSYKHVLVDEGQDLTPAQARLLKALTSAGVSLFVVADDRQSINGFAGGSFGNVLDLFGNRVLQLSLRHNFRCSRKVVEAAERVAQSLRSPHHIVIPLDAPPGDIQFEEALNPVDEAQRVRRWIEELRNKGLHQSLISQGEDPQVFLEDTAVVARARWLLDPIVSELRAAGHGVSLDVEQSGFLATPEGRLLFEGLAIAADASDRPARRRFKDELTAVGQNEFGDDPVDALLQADLADLSAIGHYLKTFRDSPSDLNSFFAGLLERFGASSWSNDAGTLEQCWYRYSATVSVQQRSIRGFLRFASRGRFLGSREPGVRVLTIHRVKGLEFKAVALVGVYEGALPDYRAKTHADVDSERRSLYVAMTRAKRALRVSWPKSTMDRWGRMHMQRPSRFLLEAGLTQ